MQDIDTQISDAMAAGKVVIFDKMPRREDLARAAGSTGKTLVFGPLPEFDQLTEYVYESGLLGTDKELQMQVTVAPVTNKDVGNVRPGGVPIDVEPIDVVPVVK